MLRSSNPVLSRQDAFTPGSQAGYQQHPQYPGQQYPGQHGYGPQDPQRGPRDQGVMTFDDVVTKTGIMLGIVVIVAAAAFFFMPINLLMPATIGAALATVVLTFIVAFRRAISPGLVFLFAIVEGVFVGGMSKVFETFYPGIVVQAVFATFVAAALTLAAYKFFNIRVTPKFTKVIVIATIAFAVVTLLNFGLALAGVNGGAGLGLRSGVTGEVSLLAIGVSALAVVLAVLNLILDFDYIERGVQMGAPASQSWKAAFGLTVTLVWLYIEMLRIISYFRR
ncbi:Bax inhibitor-1/YccA family protein [Granulicoccus sp. GXG6511]|uniref:Bax inhibitor-1/YccA family protein n=1 Tax=Granulicoccus sp. GXG6511 TaxID=3381351 RepID=UPI003D7CCCA1